MRPIDADAVFPWYLNAFNGEIGPRDVRFSMLDIKENLYNIQPLEIPHWTPCSKDQPKETDNYMTTVDYGEKGLVIGWRHYDAEKSKWNDEHVIAWQPLPEPYKESEEKMANSYCPNCHRQLFEIDVKMGYCAMCGTPIDVKQQYYEDGVTKEEIIDAVAKSEDEVRILELILDDHEPANYYTQAEMTIEEISKKIEEMEEYKKIQEMKEKKQIEEAVIITHPKNTNFVGNTGLKYVIFSYFCEENKIYMVTDEALKQAIKDNIDKESEENET